MNKINMRKLVAGAIVAYASVERAESQSSGVDAVRLSLSMQQYQSTEPYTSTQQQIEQLYAEMQ
jgi:hypothetical protein